MNTCSQYIKMPKRLERHAAIDEIENVLCTLDLLAIVAPQLKRKRTLWKWALIAAHDALQAAVICAIADTTGTNVLKKKSAAEMLTWLEKMDGEPPKEWMEEFLELIKKANLKMNAVEQKQVKKLHFFRNTFVHFTPQTFWLGTAELPLVIGTTLELVAKLMESDRVRIRFTGNKKRRLSTDLEGVRSALARITA